MRPDVTVADPRVLVGELVHDDGTRWIWFVSESAGELTVHPELAAGLTLDAGDEITLPPYGVSVRHLDRR